MSITNEKDVWDELAGIHGADVGLKPVTEAGTKKDKEEFAQLSEAVAEFVYML